MVLALDHLQGGPRGARTLTVPEVSQAQRCLVTDAAKHRNGRTPALICGYRAVLLQSFGGVTCCDVVVLTKDREAGSVAAVDT